MKVPIKRLDKSLPLPQYHTDGSAGFDFYSSADITIAPKEIARIPTGLIIGTPRGYFLAVINRSSTPQKKGLSMPNGVGVIDSDYCGESDEIKVLMYNFTDQPVVINKGERIAQGLFLKIDQGVWEETEIMSDSSRGGFGSTG